ncbi:hypothetical protein ACFLUS_04120 [Chloroflexota bacterium]
MLIRLCEHLKLAFGSIYEVPNNVSELRQAFLELLQRAAQVQRVVLVIDAIDQLEKREHAYEFTWLPRYLTSKVRVLISSLEEEPLQTLRQWLPQRQELRIGPLNMKDREIITDHFLAEYSKTFPTPYYSTPIRFSYSSFFLLTSFSIFNSHPYLL